MAETITLGIVGIKNMGEYDSQTNYEKLNVVTYQGSTYCALQETKGNLPTDTDYWQLYAEKGGTGSQGPQGPQGPIGPKGDTGNPGASPIVVTSADDMTDTTKIYVLSTDGHWYWYNGTTWEDGGVYQATQIDPTDPIIAELTFDNKVFLYNDLLTDNIKKGSGVISYEIEGSTTLTGTPSIDNPVTVSPYTLDTITVDGTDYTVNDIQLYENDLLQDNIITRRTKKLTLTGEETTWLRYGASTDTIGFYLPIADLVPGKGYSPQLPNILSNFSSTDEECFFLHNGYCYIRIDRTRLTRIDLPGLYIFLGDNPIDIYYESTESTYEGIDNESATNITKALLKNFTTVSANDGKTVNYVTYNEFKDDIISGIGGNTIRSYDSVTLGEELISADGWTTTNWTGDLEHGFSHITGNTSPLVYPMSNTANKYYQVEFDVISVSNSTDFYVSVGGSSSFDLYDGQTSPMHYSLGIKAPSNGNLLFVPTSNNFDGTISNISIKEITEVISSSTLAIDSDANPTLETRPTDKDNANVYIGKDSGSYNSTGKYNVGVGAYALSKNTSGFWNTAIGKSALEYNTVGSRNVAIGYICLRNNISGNRNIAIGSFTLLDCTTGIHNIALGADAMQRLTSGKNNIAMGIGTLGNLISGIENVGLGYYALGQCTGNGNIGIGRYAGSNITSGNDNIYIGRNVQPVNATDSNKINIGNTIKADSSTKLVTLEDLQLTNLPTSDPNVAGCLWNDNGTLKISQ